MLWEFTQLEWRSCSYYQQKGIRDIRIEDILIGNGVSELITMAMLGLLNHEDEVLLPSPDYPLWTAAVSLASGTPVHYVCDEDNGWFPSIEDIKSKNYTEYQSYCPHQSQ